MKNEKNDSVLKAGGKILSSSRTRTFIRGLIASALVLPMWVPAGTTSGAGTTLSEADAKRYIENFRVSIDGENKARIEGQVFGDCLKLKKKKLLEIREYTDSKGQKAFNILDSGYKACVNKRHPTELCATSIDPNACQAVTSPTIQVDTSSGTGSVQLLDVNPTTLQASLVEIARYETVEAVTRREETLKKEAAVEEAAVEAAAVESREASSREERSKKALDNQFDACRKSLSEIETARDAVGLIATRDGLDADAIDEMMAELDKAELKLFEKKIKKVRDQDDLDDLEDELADFADDKCDAREDLADKIEDNEDTDEDELEMAEDRADRQIDEIAGLFHQISVARVEIGREEAEDNESKRPDPLKENRLAAKSLARASKIDCLPRATKQELSRLQRDLSVDRCLQTAKLGSAYSFDLQLCQQNVMTGLNHDVARYCSGPSANGMECANARRAQTMLGQQIPALYNATVKQEQQQWQSLYQSNINPTQSTAASSMPLLPPGVGDSSYYWGGTKIGI
jgi:hypothetical protein